MEQKPKILCEKTREHDAVDSHHWHKRFLFASHVALKGFQPSSSIFFTSLNTPNKGKHLRTQKDYLMTHVRL